MELLPELDQLGLDPAVKTQVASVIQSLLEQGQRDAEQLQAQAAALEAKDHEIQEKDFKIQALTHELAHIRRLRYGVKSQGDRI